MSSETKTQKIAREKAEHEDRLIEAAKSYPGRLMTILERATFHNFEITLKSCNFIVQNRKRPYESFEFSIEYNQINDYTLDELSYTLDLLDKDILENERISN